MRIRTKLAGLAALAVLSTAYLAAVPRLRSQPAPIDVVREDRSPESPAVMPVATPAPVTNGAHRRQAPDAFVRTIRMTSPAAARLFADFARAGVAVPREAQELLALKARGASTDAQVTYVRTSFPNGLMAKAIALRWLGVGANAGAELGNANAAAPRAQMVRAPAEDPSQER